jgi:2-polyprenyl-3-methyl-5-hydroxy-6-metoxy-1,4-benzoquinol methylase
MAQHKGVLHMKTTFVAMADPATLAYPYYRDAGIFHRTLAKSRPYICPFGPLVDWVHQGSRVFDIGCGTGLWLIMLNALHRIASGVGCDANGKSLEVATRAAELLNCDSRGKTVALSFTQTASIEEWPDETFDVVSIIDVLHHIPPSLQESFLRAAWQRVRPGGRLIYKDMASSPALHALVNQIHDLILARQFIHYFPLKSALDQLARSGGILRHQGEWRRGPYAHELLVIEKCN